MYINCGSHFFFVKVAEIVLRHTHTLLEITEKIKQACDSGKYACGVLLDLQKVFDTVNHDILLKKLNH